VRCGEKDTFIALNSPPISVLNMRTKLRTVPIALTGIESSSAPQQPPAHLPHELEREGRTRGRYLRSVRLFAMLLCSAGELSALGSPHLLSAQTGPVVSPGALVRITHTAACCSSPVIGTLVSLGPDSLRIVDPFRLQASKPRAVLPRNAVVSIDVGRRLGAHKANGAALGLIAGVLAGATIGYVTACSHCDGDWRPLGAVIGGTGGGLLGAIFGTAIGSTMPHYEWTPAQLPPQRP